MANNYYYATGELKLTVITKVIGALFGAFEVQEYGEGTAYIKRDSDANVSYSAIAENIIDEFDLEEHFAEELVPLEECLFAMADKLGKGEEVRAYLGDRTFDPEDYDDADMNFLFDLARIMDDGHGLTSLWMQGAWTCDKMRLGEFGGFGEFVGKHFSSCGSSTLGVNLGRDVEQALEESDIEKAATAIATRIGWMLDGIKDEAVRKQVDEMLASKLSAPSVTDTDDEGKEVLPGATKSEIREVMMQDIVGDYDVPESVPEWKWVEENASFAHVQNGVADGIWEFILNLGNMLAPPEKLKPVVEQAHKDGIAYLVFHQGT